jgi:hypothetical protein
MELFEGETLEWESGPHWDLGLGLDAAAAESSLPDCWDSVDPDTSLSALNQSQGQQEDVVKQACEQVAPRRRERRPRLLGARTLTHVLRRPPKKKQQAAPRPAPQPPPPPTVVMLTPAPVPTPCRAAPQPLPPKTTVMTSTRVPDAPAWPGTYVIGTTGRLRMLTPSPTYGHFAENSQ